jgi:hypothetical protein
VDKISGVTVERGKPNVSDMPLTSQWQVDGDIRSKGIVASIAILLSTPSGAPRPLLGAVIACLHALTPCATCVPMDERLSRASALDIAGQGL